MTHKQALHFGIMCDGTDLLHWQAECIEKILEVQGVKASVLIVNDTEVNLRTKAVLGYRKLSSGLLFRIKNRIGNLRSKAMGSIDLSSRLSDLSRIKCRTIKSGKYSESFSRDDLDSIESFELDFILNFSCKIIRGEILYAARFGVWSFHHGDEKKYRGSPPGFWEIFNGDPTSGAILQRLTERLDGGIILQKGFIKTSTQSHRLNRDNLYRLSSEWPARVCKDILNGKADYLNDDASKTTALIYKVPNNWQMVIFIYIILCNRLKCIIKREFYVEDWNVGIIKEPIQSFIEEKGKYDIFWLPQNQKNHFRADPFAVKYKNDILLFLEEYDYSVGTGRISASSINIDSINENETYWHKNILDLPAHMSYPYVFSHNGSIYCVPETYQLRKVTLYKMTNFPDKWEEEAVLLNNFAAVDSTIFLYDGLWWLFCTDEDSDSCSNLYAWYASNLTGPWLPHEANPIKNDVRSSRPAGTPFWDQGYLYRPAQDCTFNYGGRIVINRVVTLTTTEFSEEQVNTVEPDKSGRYRDGLHTICQIEGYTIIDSKNDVFTMHKPWYKFINSVRNYHFVKVLMQRNHRYVLSNLIKEKS